MDDRDDTITVVGDDEIGEGFPMPQMSMGDPFAPPTSTRTVRVNLPGFPGADAGGIAIVLDIEQSGYDVEIESHVEGEIGAPEEYHAIVDILKHMI